MKLIIKENSERNYAQFSVYADNECLKLTINEHANLNLDVLKQLYRQFKKSEESKPIIIHLQPDMNIGKEAREYIYKMNKQLSVPPVAVIAKTFNESLVANFYKKFYKPETPFKIFRQEKDAKVWLKRISEQ